MKTLVVAPNWIGDALMAQPLLSLLKTADPGETIVALAPRWVAPVLAAMPEVDDVIGTNLAHGKLQWRERRAFARTLADRGFDRAFVLPNSAKSALIPWLARIPQRIGYVGEWRRGLVNRRLPKPASELPMVARYAALAGLVGLSVPATLPNPHLVVADADVTAVRARFGFAAGDELVALCPGAEYGPAKRWPADHFAALAKRMLDDSPRARVLLMGGAGDRAIVDEIAAGAGAPDRVHRLAGQTSLTEAIALIAASSNVVSNDSGLMHVAAALGRPQVAIFGSSDPRHTPPLSTRARVLWLHLDCSPCFQRICPLGHLNCLKQISADQVFDSLQNDHPLAAEQPVAWSS
jgi:heptosyltransferase II